MAYTFTRTGAQIEEIHNTVEDPKSNAQFSDDIRTIAGEYRGLWPDTGGSANKGDTYQTQVSGTPTGQYFTALQDTTVDPVGDDVNWRAVVSFSSISGANLLSNHNFIIASPDDSQPAPSATPTSYPPGFQIFSGVFANETTGILNLTYIDGRVSFSGGDFYMSVPNTGALENITEFVASVADFDGKPRTRGVSFALVGDEYRVTVGVDALEDELANVTPLGSVKLEQGSVATGHYAEKRKKNHVVNTIAEAKKIIAADGDVVFVTNVATMPDKMSANFKVRSVGVDNGGETHSMDNGLFLSWIPNAGTSTRSGVPVLLWGPDPYGMDSSDKIQKAIDYCKSLPTNFVSGTMSQYDLSRHAKASLDFGSRHYSIAKPLDFRSSPGSDASGVIAEGGNALIEMMTAADGWSDAIIVNNSAGDTIPMKCCALFGVKDFATLGGLFAVGNKSHGINYKSNGQSTARAIYLDMVSDFDFEGAAQDFARAIDGKVVFTSSVSKLSTWACSGIIHINNTSKADGYNSGLGLEGGGLNMGEVIAVGEKDNSVEDRFYFEKCGELKASKLISFGGKGGGLTIKRQAVDDARGMKWNKFDLVEIADCEGKPLTLEYVIDTEINCQFVKVGKKRNGLTAMSIENCSGIILGGLLDNFIDDTEYPGITLTVRDSTNVQVNAELRAIPSINAAESVIKFENSQRCTVRSPVIGGNTSFTRKYNNAVSSDAQCKNIRVEGSTAIDVFFLNTWEDLQGSGDSWRDVIIADGLTPVSS